MSIEPAETTQTPVTTETTETTQTPVTTETTETTETPVTTETTEVTPVLSDFSLEDVEAAGLDALGCWVTADSTSESEYRAQIFAGEIAAFVVLDGAPWQLAPVVGAQPIRYGAVEAYEAEDVKLSFVVTGDGEQTGPETIEFLVDVTISRANETVASWSTTLICGV